MTLLLASKSASRRAMLEAAGIAFEACAADLDERAVEAGLGDCEPKEVALALAEAKANAVAQGSPDRWVLGSDSLVAVDGRRFDKPESKENAVEHLRFFSGKVMELHSAASLVRGGADSWGHAETARLHVRDLSDEFIESYLADEWPEVGACVGVFRIEGRGPQLFERIEGDMFTVLGMPLLAVLAALRERGALVS